MRNCRIEIYSNQVTIFLKWLYDCILYNNILEMIVCIWSNCWTTPIGKLARAARDRINLEKVNLSRFILPTVIDKNCVRKEHYQSLHIVGKINWLINSNNAALFLLGDYLCCMTIKEYIWKRNCDSMDSSRRILTV
jgi:hypothetical protein